MIACPHHIRTDEKTKNEGEGKGKNMYNFTVCWNDIKYIYVSHIVYNITNWYRFIWNSCKWGHGAGEEGKVYTSLNFLCIFQGIGVFFIFAFLWALLPCGLQNTAHWTRRYTLGMLTRYRAQRKLCGNEEKRKKNFLFLMCMYLPVPYIKRHMNVFPLHFMWAFSWTTYTCIYNIHLCVYDQGPNKHRKACFNWIPKSSMM